MNCPFCSELSVRSIDSNDLADVIQDGFPVSDGHSLIIPKRHVADYFDLTFDEVQAIHKLLLLRRSQLLDKDQTITGFNVGINSGADAGQTVFHCHVHLIPRRTGDVNNPQGGVRGVIPDKQRYQQ